MKKIFIHWNSPLTAHELDRTISKLAKYGEKIFAMAAPKNIRTYPNVCVPLAAMMD